MFEAPYCKPDKNETNCQYAVKYGACRPEFGDRKGCNSEGLPPTYGGGTTHRCRDVCTTRCGRNKDGCRTDPKWCQKAYDLSYNKKDVHVPAYKDPWGNIMRPAHTLKKGSSRCFVQTGKQTGFRADDGSWIDMYGMREARPEDMELVCGLPVNRSKFCSVQCAEAGYAHEQCSMDRLWLTDKECEKYPEVCRLAKLNPTYNDDNVRKWAKREYLWSW